MSFLFKSSKKGGPGPNPAPLPAATRDIRSSDGSNGQIPPFAGSKPASPTPGSSAMTSINASIAGTDRSGSTSRGEDRNAMSREDGTRSAGPPSPEQKSLRDTSREGFRNTGARMDGPPSQHPEQMQVTQPQRLPMQGRPSGENSPYPWSQRRMTFSAASASPFPRYGAAVNALASKDGSIYLMGGLINGSTVKGDLWMVEAGPGSMTCFPVATTSEGPGPRVGHASLLVGNAFIVFGGDTKMDDGDMLDDTLYLLNTSTKQWSRALPAGPRPPGRYGHSLNILGSKIYIFGGQVEGYFFNDLVAFDLNALQQSTNRWEILIQNTIDGGPPHGQIPPARTNHTMVTWGDKLYLFGGTDGVHWFNDVWSYSPHTNSWTQLECIGYIPSPREGHAAALVGDVMYIFGGRTEEGNDLGDLAAFRIGSRRWYTFQNMGPSPSPRSGHSMTTVGKQIVVLAGEPSSAPRDPVELGMAYYLDTSKIRYPPDSAPPSQAGQIADKRRPSTEIGARPMIQQGRVQPQQTIPERSGSAAENRVRSPDNGARVPRAAQGQLPAPTGPPPQAPNQNRMNGAPPASRQPTRTPDRAFSPSAETGRAMQYGNTDVKSIEAPRNAPVQTAMPTSPIIDAEPPIYDQSDIARPPSRQKPETYQPLQDPTGDALGRAGSLSQKNRSDFSDEKPQRPVDVAEPVSRVRKLSEETDRPQDSGLGSSPAVTIQYDMMARELEQVRQKNAWYASELALARKSGYQSRDSPVLDERSIDGFNDDDRPLIEALLKMRAELARVQETIDEQSRNAAERIAEMEKQRDAAVNEAVFAKAKLAGQGGTARAEGDKSDRSDDISRRLALSLETQNELTRQLEALKRGSEAEKKARELAEDTADAAQKRVGELDVYRQQHAAEVEGLRSELHEAQREARAATADHADISSRHRMLTIDHDELSTKFTNVVADSQSHTAVLASLKDAVTASSEKAAMLEQKLQEERDGRAEAERSLGSLRAQHEQRSTELESASRNLRDAQELAQKHAEEARTHRMAVLAGLGQVSERDISAKEVNEQRTTILQQQVDEAKARAEQNHAAADAAAEKLRRAEERIAGLEAYQEQASREGLSIRKQLQATMRDNQNLATEKAGLEQKMERHKLETNALSVQHASLKDILGERGVNASEVRRSRAIDSPSSARFSTPDQHRVRELEQNYEMTLKSQDELRSHNEDLSERLDKVKRDYEEKLSTLDNDHQAAVKYLRGTEKMLSRLKQELQKAKTDNTDLKKRLDKAKEDSEASRSLESASAPEAERLKQELATVQASLKTSVAELEARLENMQSQLHTTEADLQQTKSQHASSQSDLAALHASHTSTRSDFERLQKENSLLEERAKDAEHKVQLLLDQVESSVDNYRRQSRISTSGAPMLNGAIGAIGGGHSRNLSDSSSQHVKTHSRNTSLGGDSTYDDTTDAAATGDARNSLALDSLASELETLRSQWETTKNYRMSDRFDYDEKTPTVAESASWRHVLDGDGEHEDHHAERHTPTSNEGTVRGEGSARTSVEGNSEEEHAEKEGKGIAPTIGGIASMLGGMI